MKPALAAALLFFQTFAATAAEAPAAAPERYQIDAAASQARFRAHLRLPIVAEGEFRAMQGELRGSAEAGWRVEVRVDGGSLAMAGPAWMQRLVRSPQFLAVEQFPGIVFRSELVPEATLQGGGVLRGQLTLRGRAREVAFELLPPACVRPGHECELQVRGTVSRHTFGMTAYRMTLKDEVDLDFRVRLRAEPTP